MSSINTQNQYALNLPSVPSTATVAASSYPPLTGDELLEFCSIRLQSIDANIGAAMSNQQTKVKEQERLQDFENAVTQFSPNGPQTPADWQTIQAAYNKMTANPDGLPGSDPVVAQAGGVLQQLQQATHKAPDANIPDLQRAATDAAGEYAQLKAVADANPTDDTAQGQALEAGGRMNDANNALAAAQEAQKNPPFNTVDKDTWDSIGKAPLDGFLTTLKGGAELDMLNLQSLVSQRQTVVQLVTGMMGKYDQTQEAAAAKVGS